MELPEEELGSLKKQAEKFQFDQLNHLFSLLLKGEQEIAQSAFPRTMLEVALIRMATSRPVLPVDEIMKKLEVLENRAMLKGGAAEKRISSAPGKEVHVEPERDKEKDKRKGDASVEKPEQPGEEKVVKKNEESKDSKIEEELSDVPSRVREEAWKGLINFTRAKNPILGSFLALGNLVHLSDEEIEIGFDKDSFHYERMLERENRSQLELICHEYFQKKTKVVISALNEWTGSKGPTGFAKGEIRLSESGKGLEKQEEENPIIREALRLFNGKIVDG